MGTNTYCLIQKDKKNGEFNISELHNRTSINTLLMDLTYGNLFVYMDLGRELFISDMSTHRTISTVIRGKLPKREKYPYKKISVGDKAYVVDNFCSHDYPIGSVVTIEHIDGCLYYVREGRCFVVRKDIAPMIYFPTEEDIAAGR